MMEIKIIDENNNLILEGDYFYAEGGIDNNGKYSFHIQLISKDRKREYEIHFKAKKPEDNQYVEKFYRSLGGE